MHFLDYWWLVSLLLNEAGVDLKIVLFECVCCCVYRLLLLLFSFSSSSCSCSSSSQVSIFRLLLLLLTLRILFLRQALKLNPTPSTFAYSEAFNLTSIRTRTGVPGVHHCHKTPIKSIFLRLVPGDSCWSAESVTGELCRLYTARLRPPHGQCWIGLLHCHTGISPGVRMRRVGVWEERWIGETSGFLWCCLFSFCIPPTLHAGDRFPEQRPRKVSIAGRWSHWTLWWRAPHARTVNAHGAAPAVAKRWNPAEPRSLAPVLCQQKLLF